MDSDSDSELDSSDDDSSGSDFGDSVSDAEKGEETDLDDTKFEKILPYSGSDYRIHWLRKTVSLFLNDHNNTLMDQLLSKTEALESLDTFLSKDLTSSDDTNDGRAGFFIKEPLKEEEVVMEPEMKDILWDEAKERRKRKKRRKQKRKERERKKKDKKKAKGKSKKKKGKEGKEESTKEKKEEKAKKGKDKGGYSYASDMDTDIDVESVPEEGNHCIGFFQDTIPPTYLKETHKIMFVIRLNANPIPHLESLEQAETEMPGYTMYGIFHGKQVLQSIGGLLDKVFLPLLQDEKLANSSNECKGLLIQEMQTLTSVLERTSKIEEQIALEIPTIPEFDSDEIDLKALAKNIPFVRRMEQISSDWEQRITEIIQSQLQMKPDEFSPLTELNLWLDRSTILSAVNDKLNSREMRLIIKVMREGRSRSIPAFEQKEEEVAYFLEEAKDISRFLSLVAVPLKTLETANNFGVMKDALETTLEKLHLVWTLSRFYSKGGRMLQMLEMIGNLVYRRTKERIHPAILFKLNYTTSHKMITQAINFLKAWKDSYIITKEKIEESRKGGKWEFEQSKLFAKTDFLLTIATNLFEMTKQLVQFGNFFSPTIKNCLRDPKKIDLGLEMRADLVKPFIEIKFDPFLPENVKLWKVLFTQFGKDVAELDKEADLTVEAAIAKRSNAHFKIFKMFKSVETKENLREKLMTKVQDTLVIYMQEIQVIRKFYEDNKESPPSYRYHPPISGKIWWVRGLFLHMKKSIVDFKTEGGIFDPGLMQKACNSYMNLGREMRDYEEILYKDFCDITGQILQASLRTNVLIRRKKSFGSILVESSEKLRMEVNLPSDLTEIIQEALHFEQLGYNVSKRVRDVAVSKSTFLTNKRMLQQVLDNYYAVRRKLGPHESEFMGRCIRDLETNFDQGLNHLEWTALGIPDYAIFLTTIVQKFDGVVTQVNRLAKEIRANILEMKLVRLFKEIEMITVLKSKEFFLFWETQREEGFSRLGNLHSGLSPLLLELENLTYGRNTGKHKRFRTYYAYWEKCVFNYMAKVVIRSLYSFENRMRNNKPLFEIEAVLIPPEIQITPTAQELFYSITQGARSCVEGTKRFFRWRRGSCLPVTPIPLDGGNFFTYTFYTDIGRIPRLLQLALQIQENLQNILKRFLLYLKKYREFKNLWMYDKEETVKAFEENNPNVRDYNERMEFYTDLEQRVKDLPAERNEGFIRLNCRSLQEAISKEARDWILILGNSLQKATLELNKEFHKTVSDTVKRLKSKKDIPSLLTFTQSIMMTMEIKYRDLLERYAILRANNIAFDEKEADFVETTWKRWQILCFTELPKT